MDVTIRKHGKAADVICMPLLSNVPDANLSHPDWELALCPICGEPCWKTGLCRKILKKEKDLQAACTMCAVKQGLGIGR